jgi:hypothetical protein
MQVVKNALAMEMAKALQIVANACDLVEALETVWASRGAVKSSTINLIFKEWRKDDPSWADMPEIERRTIIAAAHQILERQWSGVREMEFRHQRIAAVLRGHSKVRAKRRRAAVIKKHLKPFLRVVK